MLKVGNKDSATKHGASATPGKYNLRGSNNNNHHNNNENECETFLKTPKAKTSVPSFSE